MKVPLVTFVTIKPEIFFMKKLTTFGIKIRGLCGKLVPRSEEHCILFWADLLSG